MSLLGAVATGLLSFVTVGQAGVARAQVAAPAVVANHASLVPQTPARGYPIILKTPTYVSVNPNCPAGCSTPREVLATDQAGRFIVSGGNFQSVLLQDGSTITRQYFAAWNIDTKQLVCPTLKFDNEVTAVAAGPSPSKVYVGGKFTKITGADGVIRTRNKIALIDLSTCGADNTFVSTGANGKVDAIAFAGNRLFVGGDFTMMGGQSIDVIAEMNPTTGAIVTALNPSFSGGLSSSKIRDLSINPAGTRLVLGGRFGTISMSGRSLTTATAVIDITAPAAPVLTAHSFASPLGLNYLQDVSVSPDGSTIGLAYGTATVADFVYVVAAAESPQSYRWVHSMGDSSFGIAVSNNAVYVSGHFCKVAAGPGATDISTPKMGLDTCTGTFVNPSGAWRSHFAALSLADGTPLPWNPGQDSFVGGREMTVTTRGLLVGFDGERINSVRVGALGFLDFGPGVEDTTPPSAVTFTTPAAGATTGNPARIAGSATDNIGVSSFKIRVQRDDGLFVQADSSLAAAAYEFTKAAAANAFTIDITMPAGNYTASAKAVDVVGFVSSAWATRAFVNSGVEAIKPQTTVVVPTPDAPTESNVRVSGRASDNVSLTAIRVRARNAAGAYVQTNGTLGAAVANLTATLSPALPAPATDWYVDLGALLPADTYTVEVKLTDASGNVQTVTASLVVSAVRRTTTRALTSYTSTVGAVGAYSMGYTLTVDKEMTASALGMYDSNRNGTMDNAGGGAAGLWDKATRQQIATVTIPTNATADNGWFYAALSPEIVLVPGKTYVVGALYNGEPYATGLAAASDPNVRVTVTGYTAGGSLVMPADVAAGAVGYSMPNIKLTYVSQNLAPVVTMTNPPAVVMPGVAVPVAGTVTDNVVVASIQVAVLNEVGSFLQVDGSFAATPSNLATTLTGIGTASATFTASIAAGLPNGKYRVRVTATDGVGNVTVKFGDITSSDAQPAVTAFTGFSQNAGTYNLGYTFTVAAATTVTDLGMFDTNGNGRIDNTSTGAVALWRQSDRALLGTVSIAVNAAAPGGWSYVSLAQPVALQPGVVYVIAEQHSGEPFAANGTRTLRTGITITGYAYTPTLAAYPDNQAAGDAYGLPNFKSSVAVAAAAAEVAPAAVAEVAPVLVVALPATASGVVNTAIAPITPTVTGAVGAPTFTATGLAPGLVIDPVTGTISGTPTTVGSYATTVTVTTPGGETASASITWTIG